MIRAAVLGAAVGAWLVVTGCVWWVVVDAGRRADK